MKLIDDIVSNVEEMKRWRHDFHKHPEIKIEEKMVMAKKLV